MAEDKGEVRGIFVTFADRDDKVYRKALQTLVDEEKKGLDAPGE